MFGATSPRKTPRSPASRRHRPGSVDFQPAGATLLGGTIHLESTPKGSSTFSFTLPCQPASADTQSQPSGGSTRFGDIGRRANGFCWWRQPGKARSVAMKLYRNAAMPSN